MSRHLWRKLSCLTPLLAAAFCLLLAQNTRVEHLTIADGLSQGMIFDLQQTSDGFLWFATKDGLNRYDGHRFEVFTNDPFNPFSIAGNDINCLFEDSRENLWVSVFGKGLDVLEKSTGRFLHLPLNTVKDVGASPPYVAEAPDGTIWVGTPDGLLRLRWKEQVQLRSADLKASMSVDVASTGSQPGKTQFNRPFIQSDGTVFTSISTDGVYRFDPAKGKLTLLLPTPNSVDQAHFFENAAGSIWVKLDKKVFLMENGGPLREIPLARPSNDFRITHLTPDGSGNLLWCYSSFSKGSYFYTAPAAEIVRGNGDLHTQLIYTCGPYSPSFELDRSGNLWVGTNGYGLHKIHISRQPFQHFLPGTSIMHILVGDEVFLTTYGKGGCDLLDEKRNALVPSTNFPDGSWVFNMCKSSKTGAWFFTGVYPGDQHFLGKKQVAQIAYRDIPPINQFSPLREDHLGRLWAGAEDSRLMCLLPLEESIVYFDLPKQLGTDARVHDLYLDEELNLWVCTSNGMIKWDIGKLEIPVPATTAGSKAEFAMTTYQVYQTETDNPRSLRHNFVTSICPDPLEPKRYLWLGTKGGGLNLLDKTTGQFQHFTSQNSGLPNDVVYGILPDGAGKLWMSTNRGLSRLEVDENAPPAAQRPAHSDSRVYRFRNFREFDGLQSDEFNTGSVARGKDGSLYFGGINGLTVFDPSQITDRKTDAPVRITSLKINNQPVDFFQKDSPLQRPIHQTEQLRLDYTQNLITLEFALMDFVNPQENRFRYRLQGVDPDWVAAGTNYVANYARLRPGNYVFEVQGSIGGGDWSAPASLHIKVLPPWWAAWWAYLLYAAAIGTALYAFYKIRLRQKLEHQEALRLRELDEFKSRFFTNISHEFRTPLTVILGMAEKLESDRVAQSQPVTNAVSLIKRNGQNLLRLINQILDLAKLESKSLKINYVQGDIVPYLRYVAESLHSLANAQNVLLRVESSEAQIVMDYDPERLLQIVHNLLSNAIKFTPSGGRVTMRADLTTHQRFSNLKLTVSDTGAGIPAEDLPKIFDRFFQADNQEKAKAGGTGIGLSLTRELVKAMGGEISVQSQMGNGTTFSVRLPITNKATLTASPPDPLKGGPNLENSAAVLEKTTSDISLMRSPFRGSGGDTDANVGRVLNPADVGSQILLIEDNPDVVEYLAACLQNSGDHEEGNRKGRPYQLNFAYNGRAGIEKALETVPDLIISDVMMPEKDGFEVCDFLKNDERTSHIPIVLLTAKADVESRIAGLKRGADTYLAKPFHQEELLITVANLLELRRKLQARYSTFDIGKLRYSDKEAISTDASQYPNTPVSLYPDLEDAFLKKLRFCIEENISNNSFDGGQLAKAMNLSEVQLYRKIKALTDKSTAIFIRSIRLQKGRELLQTTSLNVSEVAYEVGFDDPNYFSRTFSQEFGVAPSGVRK